MRKTGDAGPWRRAGNGVQDPETRNVHRPASDDSRHLVLVSGIDGEIHECASGESRGRLERECAVAVRLSACSVLAARVLAFGVLKLGALLTENAMHSAPATGPVNRAWGLATAILVHEVPSGAMPAKTGKVPTGAEETLSAFRRRNAHSTIVPASIGMIGQGLLPDDQGLAVATPVRA